MSNDIKPLSNNILFQFVDDIRSGMFFDVAASGVVLGRSHDMSAKEARWGTVVAVGPDVDPGTFMVGAKILIEPLRWTEAYTYNGEKYWFTRVDEVMLIES